MANSKKYSLAAIGVVFLVEIAAFLVAYRFGTEFGAFSTVFILLPLALIILASPPYKPDGLTSASDIDLTEQAGVIAQRWDVSPISVSQDKKLNKPKVANYFLLGDTVYVSPQAHQALDESEWRFFPTKVILERQTWEVEGRLRGRNLVLVVLLSSLSLVLLQFRLPWLPVSVFVLSAAAFTGDLPSAQSANAKIAKYWAL